MYDGAAGDFADTQLFPTLDKGWAFASFEYRLAPQVSLSDIVADVTDACGFVQSGKLDQKLGGGKVDGHRFVLSGSSAGERAVALSSALVQVLSAHVRLDRWRTCTRCRLPAPSQAQGHLCAVPSVSILRFVSVATSSLTPRASLQHEPDA